MIETEMQALIVDAVIADGGQAMKMSQEYIKGVSDLLIKLRSHPRPFFLEAKRKDLSKSFRAKPDFTWKLEVTKLQDDFLRDWRRAGFGGGVVSFLQDMGGNVNSLAMTIYDYGVARRLGFEAKVSDHGALGNHTTRDTVIITILNQFAKDYV